MSQDAMVLESSPGSEETQDSGLDLEGLSSEQYDHWRLTGEAPEAKPVESPATTKTDAAPDESGKPKGNQEAGKGKGVKERNAQLDGEIQELEARLARKADLKRQLESESGDKTAPPPVADTKPAELKAPVKPKVEDFKTWDEYEAARDKFFEDLSDYKVNKALQEDRAQRAEEAKKQQQEAEGKKAAEVWNKQIESAAKEFSDWNEAVAKVSDLVGKDPRFSAGAAFLLESEVGAKVLYELGKDPDRAQEIAAMSPTKQVAALAVIAHTLTKPAESEKTPPGPKNHTEAPPPPSELSGRNQLPPDPVAAAIEADDTEAYIREANARDLAAGRRRR